MEAVIIRNVELSKLPLPEFHGDELSYGIFKKEFNILSDTFLHCMSDWEKHDYLKKCLKGDVPTLGFIRSIDHHSYDHMWESLDSIYNNSGWEIKTVEDFFSMKNPIEDTKEIESYWYTAINKLRNILALEFNLEQILITHVIKSLPKHFQMEVFELIDTNKYGIDKVNNIIFDRTYRFQSGLKSSDTEKSNSKPIKSQPGESQYSFSLLAEFWKLPELSLPEFHGDFPSYRNFKAKFIPLAGIENVLNDQQKLQYLKKCLKGDALIYIGSRGPHHDSYKDLWEYLDKKYADKWWVTTEVLKDFLCMQTPTEKPEDITSFWCKARGIVRRILNLELNSEQIFINYIVQLLPKDFQVELIKRLQWEHLDKKMYGIEEALHSFNGAIALRKVEQLRLESSTDVDRRCHGSKWNRECNGNYRRKGRGKARKR